MVDVPIGRSALLARSEAQQMVSGTDNSACHVYFPPIFPPFLSCPALATSPRCIA